MLHNSLCSLVFCVTFLGVKVEIVWTGDKPVSAEREETRFQTAERLYQRKLYPKAADAYRRLLASKSGRHRRQALQRLYDIANYWLRDGWEQVKQLDQIRNVTQADWLVWVYPYDEFSDILPDPDRLVEQALYCRNLLHWDDSKPFFNEEGRATELLQCIYDCEHSGPFADKVLYLMGFVAWFHEDFDRAKECFSRLEKEHSDSPYYPYALELAIKAKIMTMEGTSADTLALAEVRRLIHKAQKLSELSEEKKKGLLKLLVNVNAAEADIAFQAAEKCQLDGKMEEACARFQRIRDDFPGTFWAERTLMRLVAIRMAQDAKRNAEHCKE